MMSLLIYRVPSKKKKRKRGKKTSQMYLETPMQVPVSIYDKRPLFVPLPPPKPSLRLFSKPPRSKNSPKGSRRLKPAPAPRAPMEVEERELIILRVLCEERRVLERVVRGTTSTRSEGGLGCCWNWGASLGDWEEG